MLQRYGSNELIVIMNEVSCIWVSDLKKYVYVFFSLLVQLILESDGCRLQVYFTVTAFLLMFTWL